MIKKMIKKHITDENELAIANEILEHMQFQSEPNALNDFKVKMISLKNIGKHKAKTLSFNKYNLIGGERGKGKTWIMEAFLWAMSGEIRAVNKDVIHDGEDEASVAVVLVKDEKEYEIIRTMTAKANTLIINENGTMITDKIKDGEAIIRALVGFDLDLMPALMFFSMQHSFLYTHQIPSEVEKHIIRISNLDAFLELEKRCKDVQKQEQIKIDTIKEMAGAMVSAETPEEINAKIKTRKLQIRDLNKQIGEVKAGAGDVSAYEKRRVEVNKQLQEIKAKTDILHKFDECKALYNDLAAAIKEQEVIEPEKKRVEAIDAKRQELGNVQQKGTELSNHIKKMKSNIKGNMCPILQKTCTDLDKAENAVKEEIERLETDADKMREQYKALKHEIDNSGYEDVQEKVAAISAKIASIRGKVAVYEPALKGKDVEAIKAELKGIHPEDLVNEEKELTQKISDFGKQRQEVEKKVFELQKQTSTLEAENRQFIKQLDQIASAGEIMDQKAKLEKRQDVFNSLIKQFGKKGIPKSESESNLDRFNAKFAEVLEQISDGELSPTFNPDFTLNVKIDDAARGSGVASYGQSCLINMAFMIASAFILGDKVPILFVDDLMEGQPDTQVDFILKNVQKLKDIGAFVLSSSRIPKEKATMYLE